MTNYKAKEVIQAADRMRKCIDGIATYEEVITESWGTFITDGNVAGRHPLSVAHELIGLGWVALANHRNGSWLWGASSMEYGVAYQDELYKPPEILSHAPDALAAVVAAVEAVLPEREPSG